MPRDPLLEIVAQAFGVAARLRRGLPLPGRARKLDLSLSLSLGRRPDQRVRAAGVPVTSRPGPRP